MPYFSEAEKAKEIVGKYLNGVIIDIGSSGHKVVPDAIAVDGVENEKVDFVTRDLYSVSKLDIPKADVVFSSHCLEHLTDDTAALLDWTKLLKHGGLLILYLPDGRKYDNNQNPYHFRDYTYPQFLFYFKRVFCGEGMDIDRKEPIYSILESGEDFGPDKYSFYLVAQKL